MGSVVYYKKDGITEFYSTDTASIIPPPYPPSETGYTFVGYGPDPTVERNRLDWDYGETGKTWNWKDSKEVTHAIVAKFDKRYLDNRSYREKWIGSVDGASEKLEIILHTDDGKFDATIKLGEYTYTSENSLEFEEEENVYRLITSDKTKSIEFKVPFCFLPLDEEDNADEEESDKYVRKIFSFYEESAATKVNYRFWHYGADGFVKEDSAGSVDKGTTPPQPTNTPTLGDKWSTVFWNPSVSAISQDTEFEGQFSSSSSVTIKWGEGVTGGTPSVSLMWGHRFPDIPEIPTIEVKTISRITLQRTDNGQVLCVAYGNGGVSTGTVDSPELIDTTLPWDKIQLVVEWQENTKSVKSLDTLRNAMGVMPCMFATLPSSYQAFPAKYDKEGHVNFRTGFTAGYEKSPKESDGLIITRHDANFLGRISAQEQFFEQCGGYHTFDEEVCNALIDIDNPNLKGYPNNAILDYYNQENNTLRQVRSMMDNNTWNFIEKGVDGIHWKYADDNPVVKTVVDYSDSIDLSDTLFVETGVPDLYEVPYDSVLHLFAIGNIDCETLRRNSIEDVKMKTSYDKETQTFNTTDINGTFFTNGEAKSYLDIYSSDSASFGSVMIGGFQTFLWIYNYPNANRNHFEKLCPLAPFTGTVVLSKGDKIRIRNSQIDIVSPNLKSYAKTVHDKIFTDEVLKRKYRVRFANLYKRTYVK